MCVSFSFSTSIAHSICLNSTSPCSAVPPALWPQARLFSSLSLSRHLSPCPRGRTRRAHKAFMAQVFCDVQWCGMELIIPEHLPAPTICQLLCRGFPCFLSECSQCNVSPEVVCPSSEGEILLCLSGELTLPFK